MGNGSAPPQVRSNVSKRLLPITIDKINYVESFNILKQGKVNKYIDLMSHEKLIETRVKIKNNQPSTALQSNESIYSILANMFQSITTQGLITPQILGYIDSKINDNEKANILSNLENYVNVFSDGEFSYIQNYPELANIMCYKEGSDVSKIYGGVNTKNNQKNHNTSSFLNFSGQKQTQKQTQTPSASSVNSNVTDPSKQFPNFSVILLNNRNLRNGSRNSLEIASFFNTITTLEWAKAQPFFDATFILPSTSKQSATRVFKTATLNQFMFGSRTSNVTPNYESFENVDSTRIDGVKTNMSIFTLPQTAVNMDETVGHAEILSDDERKLRITSVHDKARPFMTIKDFTIDVAPSQGLMSFKTGKLSLVLHDRTRMGDIAPFIKPDLFGAFGAEIVIEYGWSHVQGREKFSGTSRFKNPIGAFLDTSRTVEKYMITNAQFTIENNGQVNINLSLAMKGPIDIRQTEVISDSQRVIEENEIESNFDAYQNSYNELVELLKGKKAKGIPFKFDQEIKTLSKIKAAKKQDNNFNKEEAKLRKKIKEIKQILNLKFKDESTLELYYPNKGITFIPAYLGDLVIISSVKRTIKLNKKIQIKDPKKEKNNIVKAVSLFKSILSSLARISSQYDVILKQKIDKIKKSEQFVKSLLGGLGKDDMFKDNVLSNLLLNRKNPLAGSKGKNILSDTRIAIADCRVIKDQNILENDYISFGSFLSSLVGTHMVSTKKYDEIQIVFNTVNDRAGLASTYKTFSKYDKDEFPLNIASLLINRNDLEEFLGELFTNNIRVTVESLISQVIINFLFTYDNPSYGLSSLYTKRTLDNPSTTKKGVKTQDIYKLLNRIYYGDAATSEYEHEPQFIPPDVHLSFDALTSKDDMQKTICRITVYDRNDNPYQSLSDIFNEKTVDHTLRRLRTLQAKHAEIKQNTLSKQQVNKKKDKIDEGLSALVKKMEIDNLIEIEPPQFQGGKPIIRFAPGFGFRDLKEKYRHIIPTATFGTSNTALINASVATINEGKLNTVYITRADRNKTSELNNQVILDMPLRILPAQASIEMFGCPWVNFGQYIFLDFETGTTIDNTYNITGIKHSLAPGKFSTSLSLSYGDVYGKYEGIADSLSMLLSKYPTTLDQFEPKAKKPSVIKNGPKRSEEQEEIKKPDPFSLSYKDLYLATSAKELCLFLSLFKVKFANRDILESGRFLREFATNVKSYNESTSKIGFLEQRLTATGGKVIDNAERNARNSLIINGKSTKLKFKNNINLDISFISDSKERTNYLIRGIGEKTTSLVEVDWENKFFVMTANHITGNVEVFELETSNCGISKIKCIIGFGEIVRNNKRKLFIDPDKSGFNLENENNKIDFDSKLKRKFTNWASPIILTGGQFSSEIKQNPVVVYVIKLSGEKFYTKSFSRPNANIEFLKQDGSCFYNLNDFYLSDRLKEIDYIESPTHATRARSTLRFISSFRNTQVQERSSEYRDIEASTGKLEVDGLLGRLKQATKAKQVKAPLKSVKIKTVVPKNRYGRKLIDTKSIILENKFKVFNDYDYSFKEPELIIQDVEYFKNGYFSWSHNEFTNIRERPPSNLKVDEPLQIGKELKYIGISTGALKAIYGSDTDIEANSTSPNPRARSKLKYVFSGLSFIKINSKDSVSQINNGYNKKFNDNSFIVTCSEPAVKFLLKMLYKTIKRKKINFKTIYFIIIGTNFYSKINLRLYNKLQNILNTNINRDDKNKISFLYDKSPFSDFFYPLSYKTTSTTTTENGIISTSPSLIRIKNNKVEYVIEKVGLDFTEIVKKLENK